MSKTGKHILILIPGFPADEQDKTCLPMVQNYLKAYISQFPGDTISIISLQYPFKEKQYTWQGLNVYAAGGHNSKFPFRFYTWKKVVSNFKKIDNGQKVDVIHSIWLTECAYIGQYISRKYKLPHFTTSMGQDCRKQNRYFRFLRLKDIYVICISAFIAKHLQANTGKKVDKVIPFGLPRPKSDKKYIRAIDILGVGSLVPVKNFLLFVEILSILVHEFPEMRCMLIGNQPDDDELKAITLKIEKENLGGNIILKGQVDPEMVFDYMERSRILLHTALYEGQAQVFIEAQSCGMSVVCFDVGHTFPEKTYICNDKEQMIEVLRHLLTDKDISFEPVIHDTMADTAKAYHDCFYKDAKELI